MGYISAETLKIPYEEFSRNYESSNTLLLNESILLRNLIDKIRYVHKRNIIFETLKKVNHALNKGSHYNRLYCKNYLKYLCIFSKSRENVTSLKFFDVLLVRQRRIQASIFVLTKIMHLSKKTFTYALQTVGIGYHLGLNSIIIALCSRLFGLAKSQLLMLNQIYGLHHMVIQKFIVRELSIIQRNSYDRYILMNTKVEKCLRYFYI